MGVCSRCKGLLPPHTVVIFCPTCGIEILDIQKEKNRRKKSTRWQIFFAFLPYVNIFAAYRIKKLDEFLRYLALNLVGSVAIIIIFVFYIYPYVFDYIFINQFLDCSGYSYEECKYRYWSIIFVLYLFFGIIIAFPLTPILVYYIRKNTMEWNKILTFIKKLSESHPQGTTP